MIGLHAQVSNMRGQYASEQLLPPCCSPPPRPLCLPLRTERFAIMLAAARPASVGM